MAKLIDEMTVPELKQELGKYNLRKTGKKDELRRRLEQFLAHKKYINSFLYTTQPTSRKDDTSPTKRRNLQIDNYAVPSSQPGGGRLLATPRQPRVTPRASPYFRKPNSSTDPAEGDSDTVGSDSDEDTNQTPGKDSVQEGDAFSMNEEEFAELVNRTVKCPMSHRPRETSRASPYFQKANSPSDSPKVSSDAAASSVSGEDAKTGTSPDTLDSSSAEMDAPRQGGKHWVMSFYEPSSRTWVKRLE